MELGDEGSIMPIFDYKCDKCNKVFEETVVRFDDEVKCECGETAEKQFARYHGDASYRRLNPFDIERVDTLGEMKHTLSVLESAGKLKGKAYRDAMISYKKVKDNPPPVVDYQKVGHPRLYGG